MGTWVPQQQSPSSCSNQPQPAGHEHPHKRRKEVLEQTLDEKMMEDVGLKLKEFAINITEEMLQGSIDPLVACGQEHDSYLKALSSNFERRSDLQNALFVNMTEDSQLLT